MALLERMKAPTDTAKSKAKHMRGRATEAIEKGRDKANDVAKSALSDDAKKEFSEALDQIFTKVRESATLAKMQDEAHRQVTDALEVARDKVKENAPAAKSKLNDAKDKAMQHAPHRKKAPSKLRMVVMGFIIVPAVVSTVFTLKKKMGARRDSKDDYDAGGELAWGESTYNPASTSSTANAEMPSPYEAAMTASVPSSNGGNASTANGVSEKGSTPKGSTPDATNPELLSE